eukprot:CAMPEP_0116851062 /NCGR_PEP_ID=MMETSP0418-20121206/16503_1 /TAXON_ID=1158023 /ORGANISM="Astrosyne radiata, Strain 13vi08-1A" /LENGTH=137 /DNA_ID=CAMNT_0004483021 /DNA_START=177 /DNA_END=586 /DNA_ORIENTATION=+
MNDVSVCAHIEKEREILSRLLTSTGCRETHDERTKGRFDETQVTGQLKVEAGDGILSRDVDNGIGKCDSFSTGTAYIAGWSGNPGLGGVGGTTGATGAVVVGAGVGSGVGAGVGTVQPQLTARFGAAGHRFMAMKPV